VKGPSEAKVREALTELGETMRLMVYKPPDDARNWKPADFLVWFEPNPIAAGFTWWQLGLVNGATMIEVKECPNLKQWPLADLRPSQRIGIRQAQHVNVPYWLAIWWPRLQRWSISYAPRLLATFDQMNPKDPAAKSVSYAELVSIYGVDCEPRHLAGTLGAALRGEIG